MATDLSVDATFCAKTFLQHFLRLQSMAEIVICDCDSCLKCSHHPFWSFGREVPITSLRDVHHCTGILLKRRLMHYQIPRRSLVGHGVGEEFVHKLYLDIMQERLSSNPTFWARKRRQAFCAFASWNACIKALRNFWGHT